jgi:cytoskeletal protein CcmA (bactofilin family)
MSKTLRSVFQSSRAAEALAASLTADADIGDDANASAGTLARPLMVLGKTLCLKGELSADEDMVLLGKVEGSITHTGSLTIGSEGTVDGDLRARVITIKGTVRGDITATESVVVAPSAEVTGDIVAPSISLVEGAKFNGAVSMPTPAAAVSAPESGSNSEGYDGDYVISGREIERILRRR